MKEIITVTTERNRFKVAYWVARTWVYCTIRRAIHKVKIFFYDFEIAKRRSL